ncbi:MAG: haloacid dehalogenase-like hydrolase [Muribaculaceae bacterium]|nr:haloacid dehalogenase-like hydrolase [Muribaculaceae bacterium]
MVDRREINSGCVVTDLDGTLIRSNSLVLFTRYLLKTLLQNAKYKEAIRLLSLVLKRKIRLCSHREMKHGIIAIAKKNLELKDLDIFGSNLKKDINPEVNLLLDNFHSQGLTILLATAADDFYIPSFISKIKDYNLQYIATKFSPNLQDYKETKGDSKLKRVKDFINKNNLTCKALISDHYDDLSLFINLPGQKFLVNPSDKTLQKIRSEFPDATFHQQNGIYQW